MTSSLSVTEAQAIYRSLERDFIAELEAGEVTAANALVKLLRLRQITGSFARTNDGDDVQVDSAKMNLLRDVLEDIAPEEPVVVFCRFHRDLEAVNRIADEAGRRSLELSGRMDELKRWQAGKAPVLAVQIDSGGLGIDLTRAHYAIYYSLGFSLGSYEQSLARVHRPGQTRPKPILPDVARWGWLAPGVGSARSSQHATAAPAALQPRTQPRGTSLGSSAGELPGQPALSLLGAGDPAGMPRPQKPTPTARTGPIDDLL